MSDCGFSCTYAKKKIAKVLDDVEQFSEYDPKTARDLILEILIMVSTKKEKIGRFQ